MKERVKPLRRVLGGAAVVAALAVAAGGVMATTGPADRTIPSSGGYQLCLANIAGGDEYAVFESIQGTRHPYKGASYTINNSVIGVTPSVSNDSWQYIYEGAPVMNYMQIDNQASGGNGLYRCRAIP